VVINKLNAECVTFIYDWAGFMWTSSTQNFRRVLHSVKLLVPMAPLCHFNEINTPVYFQIIAFTITTVYIFTYLCCWHFL